MLRIAALEFLFDFGVTLLPEIREIGGDLDGTLVGREDLDGDRLTALGHGEAGDAV